MPKLSKRGSSKKQPKEGRGSKRKRPAGEEAEEARDEFFADSDAEAGSSDAEVADADVQETAAEKRLRLGEAWCWVIHWWLTSALPLCWVAACLPPSSCLVHLAVQLP